MAVLQNVRIVTGHMDLPAGKYHDTWQLVLPGWLSFWLLHYDHHLEHHVRPRLNWYECRPCESNWQRQPGLTLHRVNFSPVLPGGLPHQALRRQGGTDNLSWDGSGQDILKNTGATERYESVSS